MGMDSKGLRVQLASQSLGLGLCDSVPCGKAQAPRAVCDHVPLNRQAYTASPLKH